MFEKSAAFYDAVYSFKDYAAKAECLRTLIEARSPGPTTLLDVACGTGKHLELLRTWDEVSVSISMPTCSRSRSQGRP